MYLNKTWIREVFKVKLFQVFILSVLSWSSVSYGLNASEFYMARDHKKQLVKTVQFDCLDNIYAIGEIPLQNLTKERFQYKWVGPNGQTKWSKSLPIRSSNKTAYIWDGLKLSRGTGRLGGGVMANMFNPSDIYIEYIGFWNVYISRENKEVAHLRFELIC